MGIVVGHDSASGVVMVALTGRRHRVESVCDVYKDPVRMDVVEPEPENISDIVKNKPLLPLSKLVEEPTKSGHVPHHLLDSRVFTKLKSNSVVEAEPPELHFSGFDMGKNYRKTLKLVNISSEVLSMHILPPQTKYFQIKYNKKYRLVPGLSYTITVQFCPDEWRYFTDCIRIHSKGEQNLLVPLHAYPVIKDLHIPSIIHLPSVPLGQSATHVIPLRCSCPVDFEFQVHCLKSHEAFTVTPLSGIIPANGGTALKVTFTPFQYETADVTLQMVFSQFNTKPLVWTVTGAASPNLLVSELSANDGTDSVLVNQRDADKSLLSAFRHTLYQGSKKKLEKKGSDTNQAVFPLDEDTSTLHESTSHLMPADQTIEMKEALSFKEEQQDGEEDSAVSRDPRLAEDSCMEMNEEAMAISDLPECTGPGGSKGSGHPKSKMLRLFQQAVHKVVLQWRMDNRLESIRELVQKTKGIQEHEEDVDVQMKPHLFTIAPEKIQRKTMTAFTPDDQSDPLAVDAIGRVPVELPEGELNIGTPLFSVKVPQHYKLMGYQRLCAYDAAMSYVPCDLPRKFRTEVLDEMLPVVTCSSNSLIEDEDPEEDQDELGLSFSAPESLLNRHSAHPLRIFNPVPHVYAFKGAPRYLECDLDFHLCPLPRQKGNVMDGNLLATQKKFLDRKDIIKGIMTWKKFPSAALSSLSSLSTRSSHCGPYMSDLFSSFLLPVDAPPDLHWLPDTARDDVQAGMSENVEVHLTPEMVKAEFMNVEGDGDKDQGYTWKQEPESMQNDSLVQKVVDRLKKLKSTVKSNHVSESVANVNIQPLDGDKIVTIKLFFSSDFHRIKCPT